MFVLAFKKLINHVIASIDPEYLTPEMLEMLNIPDRRTRHQILDLFIPDRYN